MSRGLEAENVETGEPAAGAAMNVGGQTWFLGLDAGATRCRARLRDAAGRVCAEVEGPAANAYVDFERAAEVARDTLSRALSQAANIVSDTSRLKVGLGVAGIGSAEEAERFASRFPGYAMVKAVNDAVAACIGAHGGEDGGLIGVGTGSFGVARIGDRYEIVGGRGFHLGDDGSASRLGLEAARAAMRAVDGLGPKSELTRVICARFDNDALAMVHWASQAKPVDYGAFAPLVIEAAQAGDPVARPLVVDAAAAVVQLVVAIEALGATRLAMIGGLGAALRAYLDPAISARLREPMYDPTDGAIALVGGALPEPPA